MLNSAEKKLFRSKEFYLSLQSGSGGNKNSAKELNHLIQRVKQEKICQNIQEVFNPPCSQQKFNSERIYLQGKSFKEMIFYRSVIVENKPNVQFSYLGKNSKNFHSSQFNSGRLKNRNPSNIIVISSLGGKALPHLINFYEEAPKLLSHVKKIICIEGNYTAKEWEEKIENVISLNPNSLYIYQGHSKVKKGRIQWQGLDKFFPAPEKITNYLHLACTSIGANEDLLTLPGKKNFLPIALLPDIDLRNEVNTMFALMNKNKNFLISAEQAFSNIRINNLPAFIAVSCA